ncbi:LysR family transcriptional regulator [Sphingomonas sp.]|uniref:LysR family transcriptional regulator n=1 Tax=Sphingomonas sp. TaxID=28214 RepID=UPI0025F9438E|nr:LysR family transcriptional regulator [Sphingomonas sp.]
MIVQDLNDLFYFNEVATRGGFAAASRATRIPKSKLSRRVAQLEERLGVRLIERSSRRFRVTDIGAAFHEQCRAAISAAERAEALVEASISEPRGTVRFSCPTGLLEIVSPLVPRFLALYPGARVQIVAVDRPVDLIEERIDVALRVRVRLDSDAAMTMRTLGRSRRILLASPSLANLIGARDIAALADVPTLSTSDDGADVIWTLEGAAGEIRDITHVPRFCCDSFMAVRDAAIAGLGVALLPDHVCGEAMRTGALVRVFPQWQGLEGIVHLVFTTRVGLPPLVRAWIDHIAERFREIGPDLAG